MSTEFTTDPFWLGASIMAQADQVPGKTTLVDVVGPKEDAGEGELALEVAETEKVIYVGPKSYRSVFGPINCNVFKMDGSAYWVAKSGVVIAITDDDGAMELVKLDAAAHFVLQRAGE